MIHTLDETQAQAVIDAIQVEIEKKKSASEIVGMIGGILKTAIGIVK